MTTTKEATKPCAKCPFKNGDWLRAARRQEIAEALVNDETFYCHSTVEYEDVNPQTDEEWWEEPDGVITEDSKECVGAIVLSERDGFVSQHRRIMERVNHIFDKPVVERDGSSIPWNSLNEWVHQGEEELEGEPCSVVNENCEAPAGYMGSSGGVVVGTEFVDTYCSDCGEPVCGSCSDDGGVCYYCVERSGEDE